ncbi:MAG TPA: hypothetical protein RMH99_27400, partial [Sandaracinaceae bacterium LLY-WYZ-13_1]|nr:hypothetical protein [Sandaracinaceae bacterium LLY-WYZ-13_1]
MASPEQLEAIDRELDALGKDDGALAAVIERARAACAELDDLDAALAELGEGREEARAQAVAAARESAPATPSGAGSAPPPTPSGVLPPPAFDDERTDVRPAVEVEAALGAEEPARDRVGSQSDISGLSVDELFGEDDATGAAPRASADDGGLADLFDEEPLRPSDPEVGFTSLEDELEGEEQSAPTSESTPPPADAKA